MLKVWMAAGMGVLLAWSAAGAEAVRSLVANGGFEDGAAGWSLPARTAQVVPLAGTPNTVARFYEAMSFAIPWSNTNAAWTDASGWNKTPAAWIHSQPNHPLAAVNVSDVATFGLPEAQAIANLKSALDTGHPLWFNMTLADEQRLSTQHAVTILQLHGKRRLRSSCVAVAGSDDKGSVRN